jgi:hypothetical protein
MELNTPHSNTICVLIVVLLFEAAGWLWLMHQGYGPDSFMKEIENVPRCSGIQTGALAGTGERSSRVVQGQEMEGA